MYELIEIYVVGASPVAMILKRNQFSVSYHKRILAIILSASLVLIALHLLNFQCSSKSSYLQARKETLPRVTYSSIVSNSLVKNETRPTAISTNSKPLFDRVVKWAGDEFTQDDPIYRIPPRIQQVFIANHEYILDPYRPLIQTILRQHPAFEHWFWFQKDALSFANQSDFQRLSQLTNVSCN